jgi:3-phenylpropionate/trans-cinnamate dioxygenase ferredoxin reductase subunit
MMPRLTKAVVDEDVPKVATLAGRIADLVPLTHDVAELCIALSRSARYLPGQHYRVEFRGFPARWYSPTVPFDEPVDDRVVRFHVRRPANGHVSSALGLTIRRGHLTQLTGPFGSAYLRRRLPHRLVLVASDTGFAPLWSIADAAMRERPERELVFVVGARRIESLYMIPALCRLALYRNVTIIPVVSEAQTTSSIVRHGRQTDHLPELSAGDVVYTAGAPAMVESVVRIAQAAAARCYAAAFEPGAMQ